MAESKTPVVDKKRPADEVDSEIVKLRAFAETGFQHWIKRVQGEYLARRVSTLTMEWRQASKNVPEMLAGMATLLQAGLAPKRMLDLVVAWEDVALVRYDCSTMKFKPANTQMRGGTPTGAPHAVDFLHQEIADLRRKLDAQMTAKSKSKSTRTDYLKGSLTADLIAEFLQEPGIPEWMEDLCALLTMALEEKLLEDPSVPAQDLWKLRINKYNEYGKRIERVVNHDVVAHRLGLKPTQRVLLLVPQGEEVPSGPEIAKQFYGVLSKGTRPTIGESPSSL